MKIVLRLWFGRFISRGMGCFPFLNGDAVDRQIKEAENLKEKDRARINREIEKGIDSILIHMNRNKRSVLSLADKNI